MDKKLSFRFPIETILEGKIKAVVPSHSAYKEKPSDYAPSKAPVFYNPVMELNRDFAVLALQVHQKILGRKVVVAEPLTGCGLRGVRFAIEVEGVQKVAVNDIKPEASDVAKYNVNLNSVGDLVEVFNEDANLFLCKHAAPTRRFDFVDVDPFGSPVQYMDSAIRSLRNSGLLALTATDMAPLCGIHPRACIRKYGGAPLRTEYCHELAIRLAVGCLTMVAAKHNIGINVVFSYGLDHYIRAYVNVNYGAKLADKSIEQIGFMYHCFSCFHRETTTGITSHIIQFCPNCGAKLSLAGPLWLGKIADENFCSFMQQAMNGRSFREERKIRKILFLVQKEASAPISYYAVDKICDKLNLPVPPKRKVLERIEKMGFCALSTHFKSTGFRTDAPVDLVKKIIKDLAKFRE